MIKNIIAYITFLCLAAFLTGSVSCYGHSHVDSLKAELPDRKTRDKQIELIIDIAYEYKDINVDSCLQYLNIAKNELSDNPHPLLKARYNEVLGHYLNRCDKPAEAVVQFKNSITLYKEADNLYEIAHLYNLIATSFDKLVEYDSALYYFGLSMELTDTVNNQSLLAANHNNIALVYDDLNMPEKALRNYHSALSIYRKLKQHKQSAITLNNIGLVNLDLENYEKAIKYFEEAIGYNLVSNDVYNLCISYNNVGLAYKYIDDYDNGIYYLNEAAIKSEAGGFSGLHAQSTHNLGTVYLKMEAYNKALKQFVKSLKISKRQGIISGEIYNLINIGEIYYYTDRYEEAIANFNYSLELAKSIHSYSTIPSIYNSLYMVYEKQGLNKQALKYYELYNRINDSLEVVENARLLNELQTKYESEQKELENQQLKDQNKINELTIIRQRIVMIATSFIVALTLVILLLLIIAKTKRKKRLALLEEKNKQIEEKSAELKESNETKDKLFSIIAHDLRSPFSSLLGFSSLLSEDASAKDYRNVPLYSKQLYSVSNNLFELVDNLLNWSRSQQNKIETNFSSISLKEIVQNTIDILNPKAAEKQIDITINIDSDVTVYSDSNMLMVILRNLISNAIKFTSEKGNIDIYYREDASQYTISVKDNGQGVDPMIKDMIFRSVNVVSSTGTNMESGSGIGLMLVKDFVTRLGGKVWVESSSDEGSIFSFSIPKK